MLKRVLAVNMNYIGDALMTTPTLRTLRSASTSPIDVIAGEAAGYGALDVLRGNPHIGRLIPRAHGGALARCRQLFAVVLTGYYDLVVVLPSIPSYLWAARLAGARRVIYVPPTPEGAHMAEHMLSFVAARVGASPAPLKMLLEIPDEARAAAQQLIGEPAGNRPLIGIAIGGTRPQKRWSAEAMQETVRRLCALGCRVALLGSTSDKELSGAIVAGLTPDLPVDDYTGRTSLAELAAVIERCAAIVSVDTGAMHIASALDVPLVALFGSTDPAKTGPIGPGRSQVIYRRLACSPCNSRPSCGGAFHCMASILPSEVVAAVQAVAPIAQRPALRIVQA